MDDKSAVVAAVVADLLNGAAAGATARLNDSYQFRPVKRVSRSYTPRQMLAVFRRDGFIDRHSGERLVLPAALRVVSKLLPVAFPFHKNWKVDQTHPAYWDLAATVDHVVPIADGGDNSSDNLVTTSQRMNSAKNRWTLEQLGWTLHSPGDIKDWDGLCAAFVALVAQRPDLLDDSYIGTWHRAVVATIEAD